jgi:hypothetical protein
MGSSPYLSDAEWASLTEVGTGSYHDLIPLEHANRLLDLKLIYSLLGSCRITATGRQMLHSRVTTTTAHSVPR